MKICAVICEYNPFHTGHLYQLNKISKKYDDIICLMSGNFVQRAEPAIAEKSVRATVALNCGASAVIELPIIYAVANSERFASGAIKTLSCLTGIEALAMGCETDDTTALQKIAEIRAEESDDFKSVLSDYMANGYSYAAALTEATVIEAEKRGIPKAATGAILSEPNNLLCIEYVKAIEKYGLNIKPFFIKRQGNSYNSISAMGNYLSATAIRKLLIEKRFTETTPYLTGEANVLLDEFNAHFPDYSIYDKIVVNELRKLSIGEIAKAYDCREGLEYKLKDCAMKSIDLDEILANAKSKRYTMSRLKRIVLQVALGITKEIMNDDFTPPARLLAIRETFKPYLSNNAGNLIIRGEDVDTYAGALYDEYFKIEKNAAALYSVVTSNPADLFVPKKLYSI